MVTDVAVMSAASEKETCLGAEEVKDVATGSNAAIAQSWLSGAAIAPSMLGCCLVCCAALWMLSARCCMNDGSGDADGSDAVTDTAHEDEPS